jgi:predicted RNA-binding protein with PUA-like domain
VFRVKVLILLAICFKMSVFFDFGCKCRYFLSIVKGFFGYFYALNGVLQERSLTRHSPYNLLIMNYWLIKSEPSTYSWDKLLKDKKTCWDGVRNYAARNNLRDMKKGDLAFFYHSNDGQEIVGITKIVKEHYQDPGSDDPAWLSVDVSPLKPLKTPVKLEQLKKDPFFKDTDLVRLSRLSVGKVKAEEFFKICVLGGIDPDKL